MRTDCVHERHVCPRVAVRGVCDAQWLRAHGLCVSAQPAWLEHASKGRPMGVHTVAGIATPRTKTHASDVAAHIASCYVHTGMPAAVGPHGSQLHAISRAASCGPDATRVCVCARPSPNYDPPETTESAHAAMPVDMAHPEVASGRCTHIVAHRK